MFFILFVLGFTDEIARLKGDNSMVFVLWLAGLMAAALFVYLIYALIRAEEF